MEPTETEALLHSSKIQGYVSHGSNQH